MTPVALQSLIDSGESQTLELESQPESLAKRVLQSLANRPLSKRDLSTALGQKEISGQLNKTIRQLLADQQIEYTLPDKPNSRQQQYRQSKPKP